MYHASETHTLPLEGRPGGDEKGGRPYLLLHDCPVDRPVACFAYGSRQPTLKNDGGAYVLIERGPKNDPGYAGTGLHDRTYFYPSRIRPQVRRGLNAPLGRMNAAEMDEARDQLRVALGLGKGTSRSGEARHSWRGLFAELHPYVKRLTMATYALVVTDPAYARNRRYQHLVPLVDAGASLPVIPGSLRIDNDWLKQLDPSYESAQLVIPSLFSGSQAGRPESPGMITDVTAICVDDDTMTRVDAALATHFGL